MNNEYFGIYRGVVTDVDDPYGGRRVKARVPAVLGENRTSWALLCEPLGHSGVPEVGTPVWIQFEGGDPSYPVLMGIVRGETPSCESERQEAT